MKLDSSILCSPIGIIDSGLGGYYTYAYLKNLYPNASFVLLADTLHLPYGEKKDDELKKYLKQDFLYLSEYKIQSIIIGCNTLSATYLKYPQTYQNFKQVYDIINLTIDKLKAISFSKLAIFGTNYTINSGIYQSKIKEHFPNLELFTFSSSKLATIIESGYSLENELLPILEDIQKTKSEVLILACTHYTVLKDKILKYLPDIKIIDSSQPDIKVETKISYEKDIYLYTKKNEAIENNFKKSTIAYVQKEV